MCFECKSTKHLINDCPHKDKVEKINDKVHLTLISGAEKNGQAWDLIEVLVKAILDTACSNIAVEKAWMNEYLKMLSKKCREKAQKSSRVQIIVSSCLCSWGPEEVKALQSTKSNQKTLNLIQIISQFVIFFLQNFCQTYMQYRHQSLKFCNVTYIFLNSTASKGCSTVSCCQSSAFNHPYLSCDHCDQWLFHGIFFY